MSKGVVVTALVALVLGVGLAHLGHNITNILDGIIGFLTRDRGQRPHHPTITMVDAAAPRDMLPPAPDMAIKPGKIFTNGPMAPLGTAKTVCFTFDDGTCGNTYADAEMCTCEGVHCTFLLVGEQLDKYPDDVMALRSGGHEVGIHGQQHKIQWKTKLKRGATVQEVFESEILSPQARLEALLGYKVTLVRPPFGKPALTRELEEYILGRGFNIALWSADSKDSESIQDIRARAPMPPTVASHPTVAPQTRVRTTMKSVAPSPPSPNSTKPRRYPTMGAAVRGHTTRVDASTHSLCVFKQKPRGNSPQSP